MSYIKAADILPEQLIREIQQYVDGAYIYIPRKPGSRCTWGQKTSYKAELRERNEQIRREYAEGLTVDDLCRRYYLSEKSIRRILQNPGDKSDG